MVLNEHIFERLVVHYIFIAMNLTKNYCRDCKTFSETKLWNVGENYKIESIHQNTSIHRGGVVK